LVLGLFIKFDPEVEGVDEAYYEEGTVAINEIILPRL
jgi:hypothetical protein